MEYEIVDYGGMTIVGISSRVDNSDAGFKKIELLWKEFFQRDIKRKLGLEGDSEICEAYFDYESDANGPYTIVLGAVLHPYVPPRLCCTSRNRHETAPTPDVATPWRPRAPWSGTRDA